MSHETPDSGGRKLHGTLGNLDWEQGALAEAQAHLTEALGLHESLIAKANSLVNLGCVQHDQGLLDEATEVGDDADEANALAAIAAVLRDVGRLTDAVDRAVGRRSRWRDGSTGGGSRRAC